MEISCNVFPAPIFNTPPALAMVGYIPRKGFQLFNQKYRGYCSRTLARNKQAWVSLITVVGDFKPPSRLPSLTLPFPSPFSPFLQPKLTPYLTHGSAGTVLAAHNTGSTLQSLSTFPARKT